MADTKPPSRPDESSEAPPGRASSDRLQTLANILTVLVALSAITLSVWEGTENRRHNRLSVLPHLDRITSTVNEPADSLHEVKYAVENTGLGPAVLHNFVVYRDGERVFDAAKDGGYFSFRDVLADFDALPFRMGTFTNAYRVGEMLQADEEHLLIYANIPYLSPEADTLDYWVAGKVREVLDRRSFVFCYCSVYGEDCKMTHLGSAPPPQHDVCG